MTPGTRVGRYEVPIEVFQDVRVEVKTLVVPEGGALEEWPDEDPSEPDAPAAYVAGAPPDADTDPPDESLS